MNQQRQPIGGSTFTNTLKYYQSSKIIMAGKWKGAMPINSNHMLFVTQTTMENWKRLIWCTHKFVENTCRLSTKDQIITKAGLKPRPIKPQLFLCESLWFWLIAPQDSKSKKN